MYKKIFLSSAFLVAFSLGVVGVSAFETHIIGVSAQIENALSVNPKSITFGTVFPQEIREEDLSVVLSSAFLESDRVDSVNYRIVQKLHEAEEGYQGPFEDTSDVSSSTADYHPSLCSYLSKTKVEVDENQNEHDVLAFHRGRGWADSGHVMYNDIATGRLSKDEADLDDNWNIDLAVPCFEGECAQDWPEFVAGINPNVNAFDYVLPTETKDATFMCDLWVEITAIDEDSGPWCGDGEVNQDDEECDGEAGITNGYVCNSNCKLTEDPNVCSVNFAFSYSNNVGEGDFEEKIFIGDGSEYYLEGENISLTELDNDFLNNVPGLTLKREATRLRISLHGGHSRDADNKPLGVEIVNSSVSIQNGSFSSIEDISYEKQGDNKHENGNPGQDEIYLDINTNKVDFYSTVDVADDDFYIYYNCDDES